MRRRRYSRLFPMLALLLLCSLASGCLHNTWFAFKPILPVAAARPENHEVWYALSNLPWRMATTGWEPVANSGSVVSGVSMSRTDDGKTLPLALNGQQYASGLSTYPLSEIIYDLDGKYTRFVSDAGIDDNTPAGVGGIIFSVYLDGALAWRSNIHRGGSGRETVDLPLYGIQRMRLVVANAEERGGSPSNIAIWGGARVLASSDQASQDAQQKLAMLAGNRQDRLVARQQAVSALNTRSDATAARLAANLEPIPDRPFATYNDQQSQQIWLANKSIAAGFGYGSNNLGFLSVLDLKSGKLAIYDTASSLTTDLTGHLDLHKDVIPIPDNPYSIVEQNDPLLGPAFSLQLHLATAQGNAISVETTLGATKALALYEIVIHDAPTATVAAHGFRFFDLDAGSKLGLVTAQLPDLSRDQPLWQYLTDYSRIRQGSLHDDDLLHREPVAAAAPVLIWSGTADHPGLLLADLDSDISDGTMATRLTEGAISAGIELDSSKGRYLGDAAGATIDLHSSRLLISLAPQADPRIAFSDYKTLLQTLYPQAATPAWSQFHWDSWYSASMGISAESILSEMAAIERGLGDLGTWTLYIDAGWFIAEGQPEGSWQSVDMAKFPDGIRALVDEAHNRGFKIVLYLSMPYIDDYKRPLNWLGLPEEIARNRNLLIPLAAITRPDGSVSHHYAFDIHKPETRAYIEQLLRTFYIDYDVDGILLDGLGDVHEQEIRYPSRNEFGQVPEVADSTMEWYQLIYDISLKLRRDPLIVAGWMTPPMAAPDAQMFYHSDEYPVFDRGYPNAGVRQRIDASIMQKLMLGQNPVVGYIWGAPDDKEMAELNYEWMAAGLAMDAPSILSYDLNALPPDELSRVRSVLRAYRSQPASSQTYFAYSGGQPYLDIENAIGAGADTNSGSDAALYPDSFATTRGDTTYLAGFNRSDSGDGARVFNFIFNDFGLSSTGPYLVYDVNNNTAIKASGSFMAALPAESVTLYTIRSTPGLLWTPSNAQVTTARTATGSEIELKVDGPASVAGYAYIYAPGFAGLSMDGSEISLPDPNTNAIFDPTTDILTLSYNHQTRHTFTITLRQ